MIEQQQQLESQEKIEILEKLEKAKSVKERVDLFGKVMDTFGVDAIVSLVPELGDIGSSVVSSLYLLGEGKKMGFWRKQSLQILGYQTADILVGAVPVIGDIADYFFKANRRSAKIFDKHFEKLKKEALKKGVSQEEISKIEENNNQFIEVMKRHLETVKKAKKIAKNIK